MIRNFLRDHSWIWLVLAAILVAFFVAKFQTEPGYMDAEYYYLGGKNLASGHGFWEQILWNYLDNPSGLPHPSHTYWMPMGSILAAAGMGLFKNLSFSAAKIVPILLVGLLPVEVAWISKKLLKKSEHYWIAGLLAVFPGFYIVYLAIPETFLLYMLLGGFFVILAGIAEWKWLGAWNSNQRVLLLGLTAGLMHLTRADGILWLAGAWLVVLWGNRRRKSPVPLRILMGKLALVFLGYLVVTFAWYDRNLHYYGSLFVPGSSKAMWLTSYEQTFAFPPDQINPANWLAAGWGNHFRAWLGALALNLANLLTVQGEIALLPLVGIGAWANRKNFAVQFGLAMLLITFLVMTFIFPFSGSRGGYFHSGSAFQILFWVLVVSGVEVLAKWFEQHRSLPFERSVNVFGVMTILVALGLSYWTFADKAIQNGRVTSEKYAQSESGYQEVTQALMDMNIPSEAIFMVNNAPGFNLISGYPSIAIPDGTLDNLLSAARQYRASYLVIDLNQGNLIDLYTNPGSSPNLKLLATTASGAQIYAVTP